MARGHRRGGRGSERGDGRRPAAVRTVEPQFDTAETFDFACEIAEEADDMSEGNTDLSLMGLILAARLHAGSEAIFNAALALSVKQTDWPTVEKEHAEANDPDNQDDDEDEEEDPDGDEGDD